MISHHHHHHHCNDDHYVDKLPLDVVAVSIPLNRTILFVVLIMHDVHCLQYECWTIRNK